MSVTGAFLNTSFTETNSNILVVGVTSMPGNVFNLTGRDISGSAVVSITGDNSFFDMAKTSSVSLITISTLVTTIPTTVIGTNTVTGISSEITSVQASAYPIPLKAHLYWKAQLILPSTMHKGKKCMPK